MRKHVAKADCLHWNGLETKKKLPHFHELDGLRGLAAITVFFHHFLGYWLLSNNGPFPPFFAGVIEVLGYGALGVDVFFVLSGYLITSLLLIDRDSPAFFHNFYWKRVLRILPVYLVHLLVLVIFVPHSWGYILLSLLFIDNFANRLGVVDKGPAWTLSIEEQFYLLWPQAIRRLRLEHVYYLAFSLVLMSVSARFFITWHHQHVLQVLALRGVPPAPPPFWAPHVWEHRETIFRCDGLTLGAILACQWFSPDCGTKLIRAILTFLNSSWTLSIALFMGLFLVTIFRDNAYQPAAFVSVLNYVVYRLISFLIAHRTRGGRGLGWLGSSVMIFLGNISYAMYMYHIALLGWAHNHLRNIPAPHYNALAARALWLFLVCVTLCTISRYAMEIPVLRLRRFVLRRT